MIQPDKNSSIQLSLSQQNVRRDVHTEARKVVVASVLVVCHGGSQHVAACVRHTYHLEIALQTAVLARYAVYCHISAVECHLLSVLCE